MHPHLWRIGQDPKFPIKILANINSMSFGDFTSSVFFVNSVANLFDYRVVTLIYKNDSDFKKTIVSLLPLNAKIGLAQGQLLPSFELINCSTPDRSNPILDTWYNSRLNEQHIVMSETMSAAGNLCMLDEFSYLAFPDEMARECTNELVQLGLSPDRWFCTIHCREPGYQGKPNAINMRDCDPQQFIMGVNHIIDKLGGQVVRLGHQGMTPFPERPGFIDLSHRPDSSRLQVFAISRSKFLFSGPSGPVAVADALSTPYAIINAMDLWSINEKDVFRTIDLVTPEGHVINQQDFQDRGLDKLQIMSLIRKDPRYQIRKNSDQTIIDIINKIYDMNDDVKIWRSVAPSKPGPKPNSWTWPKQAKARFTFL